jgi:ParB family transcriptional regulator, chromosome partitioning protein
VNDVSGEAGMAEEPRTRLGRGLASLIGDMGTATELDRARHHQRRVPIGLLRSNPRNPRRDFSAAQLDELADSIKARGIIQPIAVRSLRGAGESYEIIAGERRWQAAQRAGLHDVPVVVLDVSDAEALELAIIENVQREDLNPIEEAAGYRALIDTYDYHQDEVARIVGKSRSHVANMLRLLTLPEPVKAALRSGKVSAGHARALVGSSQPEELARRIIELGLNVRQVEALARSDSKKSRRLHEKPTDTLALEKRLSDATGLAVSIDHRSTGGAVHIRYGTLEQLDEIVRRLEHG